jgi:hypothetical protein
MSGDDDCSERRVGGERDLPNLRVDILLQSLSDHGEHRGGQSHVEDSVSLLSLSVLLQILSERISSHVGR